MRVSVLRLGHRAGRDKRISTHCALVARAFGAGSIFYSGEHDCRLEDSVHKIVENWGGPFKIEYVKDWRRLIKGFAGKAGGKTKGKTDGKTVHLTMYGIPFEEKIKEIRKSKRLLVIIGSEKVPGEVYKLADYNTSITSQPHSEVAALAVFLNELFEGREGAMKFKDAKIGIVPQESGKKTTK